MRLIDADALYERIKELEELARDRVIDTLNSFPNGSLNPAAIRYMAQLSERTALKEMVSDAPTIEPEPCEDAISRQTVISALDDQISICDRALSQFDISLKDEYAVKVEKASLNAFREMLEYWPSVTPQRKRGR